MEDDLIARLLADAGLAAVFGARIHEDESPRGEKTPRLVFQVVSSPEDYTYQGRTRFRADLVQFDCWAATRKQADAGRDALIAFLDTLGQPPLQAVIEARRKGSERIDSPQSPAGSAGGQTTLKRASLDVRVWATEPTA